MLVAMLLSWVYVLWFFTGIGSAKEVEVTKEWQLLGENDTIPAGMHVRMDMTTGEKWVKLPDEDETSDTTTTTTSVAAAVVQVDGSVKVDTDTSSDDAIPKYDFEMMHRTLSKLPSEEMERYGGLPELPETGSTKKVLTSKERQAFEQRMAEIWDRRQAELKEFQSHLLDVPEVLKERVRGIHEYLEDPLNQLRKVNLEKEDEHEVLVTDILSLLKDLEFQLTDVDNARDFHTLGGWELLVALIPEDSHVQNKTISKLSRATESKIRAVQAHASWTMGTAVKNTGEFHPYAVEKIKLGTKMTTALDMVLEVFCKDYKDEQWWPIRTLMTKSVYAIGSFLRGNRLAQAHLLRSNGAAKLSDKFRHLVMNNLNADIKLIQRMLSLASDIVTDIQLDGDKADPTLNDSIVKAFTTSEWCDIVSTVLTSEVFLPIRVQETVMETMQTLAPFCSTNGWQTKSRDHKEAIERLQQEWERNKDDFDPEHFNQLNQQADQVSLTL